MYDNADERERGLFERLHRLQWLMQRYHMHSHMRHGPMGDPHRGQGRVLTLLKMQPEISQKDLTYLLDMRPQSLGELLTKLERGGYIERTPSEADRRVMIIRLTEKGKQASGADEPEQGMYALFGCLSDEEQRQLGEYLSRIIEALEAQVGDDQDERGWRDGRGHMPYGCHGTAPDDRCYGPHGGRGHGGRCERDERGGFGPDGMRRDGRFARLGGCGHEHPHGRSFEGRDGPGGPARSDGEGEPC